MALTLLMLISVNLTIWAFPDVRRTIAAAGLHISSQCPCEPSSLRACEPSPAPPWTIVATPPWTVFTVPSLLRACIYRCSTPASHLCCLCEPSLLPLRAVFAASASRLRCLREPSLLPLRAVSVARPWIIVAVYGGRIAHLSALRGPRCATLPRRPIRHGSIKGAYSFVRYVQELGTAYQTAKPMSLSSIAYYSRCV